MAEMHSRFDDTSNGFLINKSETRRLEEDSGVYNSSKPTSLGSWTDEISSDDERHPADFDYFPPLIKISSGRTLYYNEIHDVETESSAEDVNSPGIDFDQKEIRYNGEDGLERITISSSNEDMPRRSIFQDDFNTSEESDDDSNHAFSYYSYPSKSKTSYSYKPKFESLPTSILKNAHVDDTISFRSLEEGTPTVDRYAPYQDFGALLGQSDKVKAEKTSYQNSPPFESRDQLNKVANSTTPLLSGLMGTETATNMPPARELKQLKSDKTKQKQRKGKISDERVDEDGNPVFPKEKYKQMREASCTLTASGKHSRVFSSRPKGKKGGLFELTKSHRDSDIDFHEVRENKKRKELNKEVEIKSEEIENYMGNKSIEEVLDFICGSNAGNKKNKKTDSTNSDYIQGKRAGWKFSKKSKDKFKKRKTETSSSSPDKIGEKVEDSVPVVSSEVKKAMGYSGAKTDYTFAASNIVNDIHIDKIKKARKNFQNDNNAELVKIKISSEKTLYYDEIPDVETEEGVLSPRSNFDQKENRYNEGGGLEMITISSSNAVMPRRPIFQDDFIASGERDDNNAEVGTETRLLEDDSGVYKSGKFTNLGSWTDEKSNDDERRDANFDYFPPQIKISSGKTLYYDEILDVETEEDVLSPRSDFDQKEIRYNEGDGLEIITISSSNEVMPRRSIFQDDFITSGESDDNNVEVVTETRLLEDSVVLKSGKLTNLGSWPDESSSDDERHPANFDYFPPQIKISSGKTLYYDEILDVETEEDVLSPKSDFDQKEIRYNEGDGLEIITISSSNEDMPRRSIFQDDFNTSGESGDDSSHAFSYYSYPSKSKTSYSYKPNFESLSTSILKNAHVDDSINIRSLEEGTPTVRGYAPYQDFGALSGHSDKVKAEKTNYKNSLLFGSRDQLNKVANSITPLLSRLTGTETATNMPPARELKEMKADKTKKKKKKKKISDELVNENGSALLFKNKHKQMKEAPPAELATVSGKSSQEKTKA